MAIGIVPSDEALLSLGDFLKKQEETLASKDAEISRLRSQLAAAEAREAAFVAAFEWALPLAELFVKEHIVTAKSGDMENVKRGYNMLRHKSPIADAMEKDGQ